MSRGWAGAGWRAPRSTGTCPRAGHVPPTGAVVVHEDFAIHVPHFKEPGLLGAGIRHPYFKVPHGVELCGVGARRPPLFY